LEQLNKPENNIISTNQEPIIGIPKVYFFDRYENRFNYLVMELLGPSLSDLFQLKEKNFSLETVLLIGYQVLTRIEMVHEKGFLHRDIKPENFVIGLGQKSNMVHIIDFGLSKRYKDKTSGQHIPYRENRDLVGTVRYASINAHLGIEQSRRDDIEGIGYILVYLYLGRLPWQGKQDKAKPQVSKIMEKKLITPPEILCKKMPIEFSYYFHYCRNLKFEDRPDYNMLKKLFMDVLVSRINLKEEFLFDWFDEDNSYMERKRLELNSSESGRIADLKEDKKKKNGKNLIEEYIKEESREESNIKNDYPKFKQNNDIMNDLLNNQKAEKNGENLIDDAQSNEKKDSDKDKNSKSTGSFQIINKKSEEK
jgi:serine/threonine protein kinase